MVTPQFDVKIIDFGLATYSDEEDYTLTQCGTQSYLSPEIMKEKKTMSQF